MTPLPTSSGYSPLPGSGALSLPEADRSAATVLHLSPLADLLLPTIGGLLGPLAAWLAYRDRSPALDAQGKEVLNFRLSLWLYGLVLGVIAFALFSAGLIGGAAGAALGRDDLGALAVLGSLGTFLMVFFPVFAALSLVPFLLMLVGVMRSSSGQLYRYPLTIRFLR